MTIESYQPQGLAAEVIASMVYHRDYLPAHEIERFLPDGGVELVIDLGDTPKFVFDNASLEIVETYTQAWISGIRTRPISISSGYGEPMLVIGFASGAARRVLWHPMHLLADTVVDAEAVFGSCIRELRGRLLDASTVSDMFRIAERWVTQRIGKIDEEPAWLRSAAVAIAGNPTARRIDTYARECGISGKHLSQKFRDYIGITPKQYQRVHRFQAIVKSVDGMVSPDWIGLAHDCGLYDQSHLISEFRQFSGYSPVEYLARRGDVLNYVPVASR